MKNLLSNILDWIQVKWDNLTSEIRSYRYSKLPPKDPMESIEDYESKYKITHHGLF